MEYVPSRWVMLEFEGGTHRKVLAGFGSDEWRLNSGVEHTADMGDHWLFYGFSGSVYRCYKDREGMGRLMADMLAYWQHRGVEARVVDV